MKLFHVKVTHKHEFFVVAQEIGDVASALQDYWTNNLKYSGSVYPSSIELISSDALYPENNVPRLIISDKLVTKELLMEEDYDS